MVDYTKMLSGRAVGLKPSGIRKFFDILGDKKDVISLTVGQPDFVTADMVKEGAVIIDVGTTRVPDASKKSGFKLTGDVKFDEVAPKCSYITPVPGGVGPMTIVSLMKNTLLAGKKAIYK